MLKVLRRGSRPLLWIVIIGVGAVFVLYLGFQGGFAPAPGSGPVVRVGPYSFEGRDLERVRFNMETRYREALGDQFDATQARSFLIESAGNTLLRSGLLAWQGEQMGLTVSDAEVRAFLRTSGFADESGQLDRDGITAYAEQNFGSLRRFQERLRSDLLAEKTAQLIRGSASVSDGEVRDAIRYQLDEAKIAAVRFDGRQPAGELEVPEEAGAALLAAEPERVFKRYEQRKAEFDRPERARVRHLLVAFDPEDAAAREEAEQRLAGVRERIAGGEDFAEVAMDASDDAATKAAGGEIGWLTRGSVVPEIDAAAFSQPPGELGEPVESTQGLHLILVEEREAASVVPFEEAQRQVALDLARVDAGVAAARAQAESVAEAVAAGQNLVDVARERGLSIIRPDPLRRRPDGYIQQIGVAPDVLTAAFTLDPESPSDPTIHEAGDDVFVLIQLLERNTPTEAQVAESLASRRDAILSQRRAELETLWLAELRDRLGEAHELTYDLAAFLE
jgi:peptidyl-prolyl cis-trans isomerase D